MKSTNKLTSLIIAAVIWVCAKGDKEWVCIDLEEHGGKQARPFAESLEAARKKAIGQAGYESLTKSQLIDILNDKDLMLKMYEGRTRVTSDRKPD